MGEGSENFKIDGEPKLSNPEYVRSFGPITLSPYVGESVGTRERADTGDAAEVDMSSLGQGYVVATSTSSKMVKFRVEYGPATGSDESGDGWVPTETYFYALNNAGQYEAFPLAHGDGHYRFTVFINVSGNEYEPFFTEEADVVMDSQFEPFLRPNQIVNYSESSSAVRLGQQLAEHCVSNLEIVRQVYFWVKQNITYDTSKVDYVRSDTDYLPDLEQVLRDNSGICYDYAALVAAMLRSNGIPCKLITGNVLADGQDLYHAWNMIWLEEQGWVTIEMPTSPEEWERIDLTFAASGDPDIVRFVGDGENYTDIYVH
jgi:transglutaminase-like putative cysteine protease